MVIYCEIVREIFRESFLRLSLLEEEVEERFGGLYGCHLEERSE
jgi:hypothetical protein